MPTKFRPGDREALRLWAHFLIEHLLDLRFETDPAEGTATEEFKDLKAFQTLESLGKLTAGLGDWAINHEVGLAIAELGFVPWVAWSGQQSPEFLAARAQANNHRHEEAGLAAKRCDLEAIRKGQPAVSDPNLQRRILINLLTANVGGFPRGTAAVLATALKALSYNEVLPILEPKKKGLKVGFREIQAQLETIAFLEYRVALGTPKKGLEKR